MENKKDNIINKIIKNRITKQKLSKYFAITNEALNKAKKAISKKNKEKERDALNVLDMAQRYFDDAKYFKDKGDYVNAFACLNYAHGWLDCGNKIGLFNVNDTKFFVTK